jgi:hypothetical protein
MSSGWLGAGRTRRVAAILWRWDELLCQKGQSVHTLSPTLTHSLPRLSLSHAKCHSGCHIVIAWLLTRTTLPWPAPPSQPPSVASWAQVKPKGLSTIIIVTTATIATTKLELAMAMLPCIYTTRSLVRWSSRLTLTDAAGLWPMPTSPEV